MRERRAVCQYITANYGYNCVTFNYRLAPENLWSAPLEGCLTAYAARLKTGFSSKNVVFMGESAGGTLVLSLALLLKEKGFPQPKRWCLSPPVLRRLIVSRPTLGIAAIVCVGHYVGFSRSCRSQKDRLPNKDSLSGI